MSNRQRFTNKVVIVTGSAQGIGRGVALQVAAEGGQVIMADRSEYVEEVLKEIQSAAVMLSRLMLTLKPMQVRKRLLQKPLNTMVGLIS